MERIDGEPEQHKNAYVHYVLKDYDDHYGRHALSLRDDRPANMVDVTRLVLQRGRKITPASRGGGSFTVNEHYTPGSVVEGLTTGLILLNLPVAIWAEITHNYVAERIDLTILCIFAVEITFRWVLALRKRAVTKWLMFDTLVMVLALSGLPITRVARITHLGRHVHGLRHVTLFRWFKIRQAARET